MKRALDFKINYGHAIVAHKINKNETALKFNHKKLDNSGITATFNNACISNNGPIVCIHISF